MKVSQVTTIVAIPAVFSIYQKLHVDLHGGVSNYAGDLQRKRFTFSEARPGRRNRISYDLSNKFIVLRTAFTYAKVAEQMIKTILQEKRYS